MFKISKLKTMRIFKVFDVKYDTDNEVVELPNNFLIEVHEHEVEDLWDENEIEEVLSDKISDIMGFCHYGFNYTEN